MESIKNYVEDFIRLTGISGNAVPIVRHILLVLIAILLGLGCWCFMQKLIIPIVRHHN